MIVRRLLLAAGVLVALVSAGAARAEGAKVEIPGSSSVSVGDSVPIRITGFDSLFVTISTCGNEARRGSVDCNLVASKGLRLNADGASDDVVVVAEPPMKCPCLIRVANDANDEVATVPIRLAGQPSGPVVDPAPIDDAIGLTIQAHTATDGFLDWARGAIGGSARYSITVEVANRTTATLRNVRLFGSVGRGTTDELAPIDVPNPGPIAPGATWTDTVYAEVPAPSVGTFRFRMTAAGAGASVDASVTERHSTPLLLGVLAVLVLDLVVIVVRRLDRRRRRRQRVATPSTTTA
ncbi:MAG: hypothetical protein RI900_2355 [Actinomycetota bacterium]|jgi:hypothetical protein